MKRWAVWVAAVAAVLVGARSAKAALYGFLYDGSTYTTINPPGSNSSTACAVSGNSVVGWYTDASGHEYGFLSAGLGYATIAPPGSIQSECLGISGNNVVGWYIHPCKGLNLFSFHSLWYESAFGFQV